MWWVSRLRLESLRARLVSWLRRGPLLLWLVRRLPWWLILRLILRLTLTLRSCLAAALAFCFRRPPSP